MHLPAFQPVGLQPAVQAFGANIRQRAALAQMVTSTLDESALDKAPGKDWVDVDLGAVRVSRSAGTARFPGSTVVEQTVGPNHLIRESFTHFGETLQYDRFERVEGQLIETQTLSINGNGTLTILAPEEPAPCNVEASPTPWQMAGSPTLPEPTAQPALTPGALNGDESLRRGYFLTLSGRRIGSLE